MQVPDASSKAAAKVTSTFSPQPSGYLNTIYIEIRVDSESEEPESKLGLNCTTYLHLLPHRL